MGSTANVWVPQRTCGFHSERVGSTADMWVPCGMNIESSLKRMCGFHSGRGMNIGNTEVLRNRTNEGEGGVEDGGGGGGVSYTIQQASWV